MTPKEQAAMQQALEALELARGSHGVMLMSNPPHDAWQYRGCDSKLAEAITALREALAEQAEQEPVACPICGNGYMVKHTEEYCNSCGSVCVSPQTIQENVANKKAAPVRTKDLTDDEIVELIEKHWDLQRSLPDFARAVIAADREKNK